MNKKPTWIIPDKDNVPEGAMWLIYFEDNDKDIEIISDEKIAKTRYRQLVERWAVHLFKQVPAVGWKLLEDSQGNVPERICSNCSNNDNIYNSVVLFEYEMLCINCIVKLIKSSADKKMVNATKIIDEAYEVIGCCVECSKKLREKMHDTK